MSKLGFEQGVCEKCGYTEFYKDYTCKNCAKLRNIERLKQPDRPCPHCDDICEIGYGYCYNCKLKYTRNNLKRTDRPCPHCDKMCDIGCAYCKDCDNRVHKKLRIRDGRLCPKCKITNCADGLAYCNNCANIINREYKQRPDRPCPHCNSFCKIGGSACVKCMVILSTSYTNRTDRPCPRCNNFCMIGSAYCCKCSQQVRKEYVDRDDRPCSGYIEPCGNLCSIGHGYCNTCRSAKEQSRRAMKKDAEGGHTGRDRDKLYKLFNNICLECLVVDGNMNKQDIQIDHMQSLNNGGSNGIYNLQPLCLYHNSSKNAKNINYIQPSLDLLAINLDTYLDIIGLDYDDYDYLLTWWENLGIKEYNKFIWE